MQTEINGFSVGEQLPICVRSIFLVVPRSESSLPAEKQDMKGNALNSVQVSLLKSTVALVHGYLLIWDNSIWYKDSSIGNSIFRNQRLKTTN